MTFIFLIVFILVLFTIMNKVFEHRRTGEDWTIVLINRTSVSFLLMIILLAFSYLYTIYFTSPTSVSSLRFIADIIISLPVSIILAIGYSGGDYMAYLTIFVKLLILTLICRLFIADNQIVRLRRWIKNIGC